MDSHWISNGAHDAMTSHKLSDAYNDISGLLDLHGSPDTPLSNQTRHDSLSALSCCQEQHSSIEAPSRNNSPYGSSIDSKSPHAYLPADLEDNIGALQKIMAIMNPDPGEGAHGSSYLQSHFPVQDALSSAYAMEYNFSDLHQYATRKYQKLSHGSNSERLLREMGKARTLDIRLLLIECARALSENRLADFEILVEHTRNSVSIIGDPIQRVGAYMLEGLVARNEASGTRIYRSLRCQQPLSSELLSYMHILYDICPYLKFGYMAANGAIAEAVRNEDWVHVVDFQICQGTQWVTLIQALAKRPGCPPHLRITGIDDDVSRYARGDGLQAVGRRLAAIAEKFNVPFEFQTVPVYGPEVTREMLNIRPGEALAVNFTLQLHHTPDESVDINNPRDELLRMVKSLSPKVMTLVEQESNTNTAPFLTRFIEILDYYLAMFDSIDEALPRENKERINMEQHCLAKDIVNVIACEGRERIERHELLGKWRSRLAMAGFKQCPLSTYVNSVIRPLLHRYSDKYTLVEKEGAMLLGWKDRNLISASAWN